MDDERISTSALEHGEEDDGDDDDGDDDGDDDLH